MDCGIQVGGRVLGPGRPALLVAEIGGNHGGDPALAAALVRAAAAAGAGGVKFQAYRTSSLVSKASPYFQELAAEELPFEDLAGLVRLGRDLGLVTGLTVFDEAGLDLAREAGADFLKIASGDLNHHRLLALAFASGHPVFVSTGAGDESEVEAALALSDPARTVFLQCAALYPAPPASANLAVMAGWLARGLAAGYSDHGLGSGAARLALALGALVLEKHFTLVRTLPGGDNAISATPEEFHRLAAWAGEVCILTGDRNKRVQPEEQAARPLIRRAVLAARALAAGTRLAPGDLALKRPPAAGTDLLGPEGLELAIGRRLARPLAEGEPLTRADLADG
ncbi:MAG: N-acetylneuraminate synthase family protein [Candidatus Adiutrix sp.]|nr:N-acetylneuraminate synthase family protein [Candidatus Adiutrix sp.]